MGQLSLILIVGFLCLFTYDIPESIEEFNEIHTLLWTILLTLGPVILAYGLIRFVDRYQHSTNSIVGKLCSPIGVYRVVFEVLCLMTFLLDLYVVHLPILINLKFSFFPLFELRQVLVIVPLLISLIGVRFVFNQINKGGDVSNVDLLSFQLKFLLLPFIPLVIYLASLDLLVRLPDSVLSFIIDHPYLLFGLLVPVIAGAYIFAPILMQFMWKTVPLTDTTLREKLARLTEKSRLKYRDIVVWQTGTLLIANAAVAGVFGWNRRIFITDTLLQYFTDDHIETIVAHELGHIRFRHIPTYILFSCLYLLSYPLFFTFVENPIMSAVPTRIIETYPVIASIGSMTFFILYFIFGFRYVSRRFEYQADYFAVSLTNKPEEFKSALERLALFNSIPRVVQRIFELFNTHPSIHRRVDFVDKTIRDEKGVLQYGKYLVEAKLIVLLIPILTIVGIIFFLS